MLQLSQFVWTPCYSVWDVFNNFLLKDATDRSKINSDQKRVFIALSLYPLSFFVNTPFKYNILSANEWFGKDLITSLPLQGPINIWKQIGILFSTVVSEVSFFVGNPVYSAPEVGLTAEYGGKWKMSHYYAVNFFSPTLISPVLQEDFINIHVVCDEMNSKEHLLHIRESIN